MTAGALEPGAVLDLPDPVTDGDRSVERVLANRRSRREFAEEPLELDTVAQLLWAAQGVTEKSSEFRTAPSAGATFPLEVILVVRTGGVRDLEAGVYRYDAHAHALKTIVVADRQGDLRTAAIDQAWIENAPVTVALAGVDERTEGQYGDRGTDRYVPMEAGHAGQNLYLQAEALDLATVAVGAFEDAAVSEVLELGDEERPLYLFPVGRQLAES